jgi:ABC-type sugar transport system ATPase subunit
VRGVSQPGTVHDISFEVRRGEILGVSGLMGSGRSELARIIFGLDPYATGSILIEGKPLIPADPRAAMEAGLAFLTEDRRAEGLLMQSSIKDNLALPSLAEDASPLLKLLRRTNLGQRAADIARAVQVNASDIDATLVRTLSGGNQQKVVIGKWLLRRPSLFILDEPTRGIDVGAKYEVYKIMNRLVAEGSSILCISSEIEELIGMCDRIMVMSQGEVKGFRERVEFDREELLRTAMWTGGKRLDEAVA